jgi:hypothetical protein
MQDYTVINGSRHFRYGLKGELMPLTESEKKILNELLRKQRDENDSAFGMSRDGNTTELEPMCEIWNGDKYARVPVSVASPWLESHFGIKPGKPDERKPGNQG